MREKSDTLERKRVNPAKFSNVKDMRKHLNAYRVLHLAGYDRHALREIAKQFENSVGYAMREITSMSERMQEMREEE
jgi:hypothetical protein